MSGSPGVWIYKLKAFARFQRKERMDDAALVRAVVAAEAGLVDAELGGGLIKRRIARTGQGKSGGYRTVIAFRRGERAVFFFGFAKNERGNIDGDELDEFKRLAQGYLDMSAKQIARLIDDNELMEVRDGEHD